MLESNGYDTSLPHFTRTFPTCHEQGAVSEHLYLHQVKIIFLTYFARVFLITCRLLSFSCQIWNMYAV